MGLSERLRLFYNELSEIRHLEEIQIKRIKELEQQLKEFESLIDHIYDATTDYYVCDIIAKYKKEQSR